MHLINKVSHPLLVRFDAFSNFLAQTSSHTWSRLCVTSRESQLLETFWMARIIYSPHVPYVFMRLTKISVLNWSSTWTGIWMRLKLMHLFSEQSFCRFLVCLFLFFDLVISFRLKTTNSLSKEISRWAIMTKLTKINWTVFTFKLIFICLWVVLVTVDCDNFLFVFVFCVAVWNLQIKISFRGKVNCGNSSMTSQQKHHQAVFTRLVLSGAALWPVVTCKAPWHNQLACCATTSPKCSVSLSSDPNSHCKLHRRRWKSHAACSALP